MRTTTATRVSRSRRISGIACALVLFSRLSAAQTPPLDGPPASVLPQTEARDDRGHVTIRAVRLKAPLRVDGRLDERINTYAARTRTGGVSGGDLSYRGQVDYAGDRSRPTR